MAFIERNFFGFLIVSQNTMKRRLLGLLAGVSQESDKVI